MTGMGAIGAAWHRFWFRPEPTSTLAVVRIAYGMVVFLWAVSLAPDLHTFFPTSGAPVTGLYVLLVVGSVGMVLGYRSRLAAAVVFLALMWFQRRNSAVINAGDRLLANLGFFLMLAPSGASLSLDRWRRAPGPFWEFPARAPWALRLVQVQLSVLYLSTVWEKLQGQTWANGTAVSYALGIGQLARVHLPDGLTDSVLLMNLLTWSTLVIELSLALLVWRRRLRPWVLGFGVALHVFIEVTMMVGFLGMALLVAYLAFVPPAMSARLLGRPHAGRPWRRTGVRRYETVELAPVPRRPPLSRNTVSPTVDEAGRMLPASLRARVSTGVSRGGCRGRDAAVVRETLLQPADGRPVAATRRVLAVFSVVIASFWFGTSVAGAVPADGARPPTLPTLRPIDFSYPPRAMGGPLQPDEIGVRWAIPGPGHFTGNHHRHGVPPCSGGVKGERRSPGRPPSYHPAGVSDGEHGVLRRVSRLWRRAEAARRPPSSRRVHRGMPDVLPPGRPQNAKPPTEVVGQRQGTDRGNSSWASKRRGRRSKAPAMAVTARSDSSLSISWARRASSCSCIHRHWSRMRPGCRRRRCRNVPDHVKLSPGRSDRSHWGWGGP